MEKNSPTMGIVNILVLLAAGVASLGLALYDGTFAGQVAAVFFAGGFLTAVVGFLQMRLEDRERLEKLDFDEMNKSSKSSSLFTGAKSYIVSISSYRNRSIIPAVKIIIDPSKN